MRGRVGSEVGSSGRGDRESVVSTMAVEGDEDGEEGSEEGSEEGGSRTTAGPGEKRKRGDQSIDQPLGGSGERGGERGGEKRKRQKPLSAQDPVS